MLAAKSALGAENAGRDLGDFYRSGELSVDLFGSASLGEFTIEHPSNTGVRQDIRFGGGVGINYFITRNIGIGADAYSENNTGTFVDSASANLILRLPLGQSRFAPYAFGGGGRQFDLTKVWFGQVGAGMEYRITPNIGAFMDARWVLPEEAKYYGVARLGIRFAF